MKQIYKAALDLKFPTRVYYGKPKYIPVLAQGRQEAHKMINTLYSQTKALMQELGEKAKLGKGSILVVGCSTSEIIGSSIGTNSSPEAAKAVFEAIYEYTEKNGILLAVQCCEHLNRAIITEKGTVPFAREVNVIPQPKAGGSMATEAYTHFKNPVALEEIQADAGIDIGFTLIGMHIKSVAVPVRLENNRIGEATVIAARSRPKFIGGERAIYNQALM